MAKKKSAAVKAWETRRKNEAQEDDEDDYTDDEDETEEEETTSGFVKVEYGHPGRNGMKAGLIAIGSTHEQALRQMGIEVNPAKEGILAKDDGRVVMFNDKVTEGVFMICPGVNSQTKN
jgi:hypothetical protein